jgi:hypothetical protein
MAKINFGALYQNPESILHSLESFIGLVDFDRLGVHLRNGGMMGSPASTAAYLMNASQWDEAAEGYLKEAVANGRRIANGMVTTVFPMSTFEFAWVSIVSSPADLSQLAISSRTAWKWTEFIVNGSERFL